MKKFSIFVLYALLAVPVTAAQGLPFIQDDYTRSVSQAKQRNIPIFVECWAPW